MKKLFSIIVGMMLLPTHSFSWQSGGLGGKTPRNRVQLMEAGTFHGDEIRAKSGEHWLGLYPTKTGYVLRDSIVQVKRAFDAVVDEDESRKTGKEVSVNHATEPIFLIKGATMLQAGAVATVFAGEKDLPNSVNLSLKLDDINYHLKVIAKKRKANPLGIAEDAKLVLMLGNTTQVLEVFGDDTEATSPYWGLLWAGDLDQDGKLDLYVDVRWQFNFSQHKLFLSSQAAKGRLVKEVAQFQTSGC